MAKVTAPLFGFSARGQLGKSIVNASWRGRAYVRRYTIPANPRTVNQTGVRDLFRFLQELYKRGTTNLTDPWMAFAKGQPLTDRNAFTQANMKAMFGAGDMSAFLVSNGAKGGLALASAISADTTGGNLQITFVAPTPPPGWSLLTVVAVAVLAQDPTSPTSFDNWSADRPTSPLVVATPGGDTYQWAAYPVWIKPDASRAYGTQISGQQILA